MANLNGLAGDTVAQVVTYLLNRLEPFVDKVNVLEQILVNLKDGTLQIEQIERTEQGTFVVHPLGLPTNSPRNGERPVSSVPQEALSATGSGQKG